MGPVLSFLLMSASHFKHKKSSIRYFGEARMEL
nr:MAG TPA: hypothetical protein [Caudoviricetes sp.]